MVQQPRTPNSHMRILLAMAAASMASAKLDIAGIYPTKANYVSTYSRIDLDQTEIERLLDLDIEQHDDANWVEQAKSVYEKGMHAGPMAQLTLKKMDHEVRLTKRSGTGYTNDLNNDKNAHTYYAYNVVGTNEAYDTPIRGSFSVEDPKSWLAQDHSIIFVGYPEGNTCMQHGKMDQCFAKEGAILLEGNGAMEYSYNPKTDNKFSASLKKFSEEEGLRMLYCEEHGGCNQYEEYQHFFDHYGLLDYGDHWIQSAFASTSTNFPRKKLVQDQFENVDFSLFSPRARNAAITTATVAMNVFTIINRLMVEMGLDGCRKYKDDYSSFGSSSSIDNVVAAWDNAAAVYAGSELIAPHEKGKKYNDYLDPDDTGSLYYRMAAKLGQEFGYVDREGRAMINEQVYSWFKFGRDALIEEDCDKTADFSYKEMVRLMRVPWIQGVLKAAFIRSSSDKQFDDQVRDEERGRGEAFMAALMPDLTRCSKEAASIVYNSLKTTKKTLGQTPDYMAIRDALEDQYECLGVTCEQVGGFLNPKDGEYFKNTHPCGGYDDYKSQRREKAVQRAPSSSASSFAGDHKAGFVTGGFFVALAFFGFTVFALVVTVRNHAQGRPMTLQHTARSMISGIVSQADFWLSRNQQTNLDGYHVPPGQENDYDVQLRPMRTPLRPGEFAESDASLLL